MRGIILAGGTGSRLGHLTKTINKHLLPVGGVPMIFHPLRVLRDNNITDITIVSTPHGVGQIAELLGSGAEHGCTFTYRVQDQPGGIAQALKCAESESDDDMAVILGDNIFWPSPVFTPAEREEQALCFLYRLLDNEKLKEFGVPMFDSHGQSVIDVIEKPTDPPSEFAVSGLYVFPASVRMKLLRLTAGNRGEYEISDVLRIFARNGYLAHTIIGGFWGDAGTPSGLAKCSREIEDYA